MESIKTTDKIRTILYIDNDRDLMNDIKDYLEHHEIRERHHINFIFVHSVKEALKKIAEMKIDLIVLEIMLPVISGYYLLKTLKNEKEKIPVVIYTRLKGPQDLAKMAAAEVENIFVKQLMKMEDLIDMIVTQEEQKVEMDKVLLELQSQIKSVSDSEKSPKLKLTQCPRCNMILTRDSHFCNNCGQRIFQTTQGLSLKESREVVGTTPEAEPAPRTSPESEPQEAVPDEKPDINKSDTPS
jgi:CheY-like chemotaxis protein